MEEEYTLKMIFEALQRFGQENKSRFEQIDRRFEQIDKRLDKMQRDIDQRFDMVDRRLESLEKDVREIKGTLKIIEAKNEVYNRKFEAIGKGALA